MSYFFITRMKILITLLIMRFCHSLCIKLEDYMVQIDSLIVKRLTKPNKKYIDDILPSINLYNVNLHNIIVAFSKKVSNCSAIVNKLLEAGKPQFLALREELNLITIQKEFDWELCHIHHLNYTFDDTEHLWNQLEFWWNRHNATGF
ncbi:hypothetical protein J6590_108491 [Homalodisca vitripennis]|nr:hypothetical protein J6590_108491 [Homalodisca vitripennis]